MFSPSSQSTRSPPTAFLVDSFLGSQFTCSFPSVPFFIFLYIPTCHIALCFFAFPVRFLYKLSCVPSCITGEFLPTLPEYFLCCLIVCLPVLSCVPSAFHHVFLYPDLHPRPNFSLSQLPADGFSTTFPRIGCGFPMLFHRF